MQIYNKYIVKKGKRNSVNIKQNKYKYKEKNIYDLFIYDNITKNDINSFFEIFFIVIYYKLIF